MSKKSVEEETPSSLSLIPKDVILIPVCFVRVQLPSWFFGSEVTLIKGYDIREESRKEWTSREEVIDQETQENLGMIEPALTWLSLSFDDSEKSQEESQETSSGNLSCQSTTTCASRHLNNKLKKQASDKKKIMKQREWTLRWGSKDWLRKQIMCSNM